MVGTAVPGYAGGGEPYWPTLNPDVPNYGLAGHSKVDSSGVWYQCVSFG